MESTNTKDYADYLIHHQKKITTKVIQLPYQVHLQSLRLGKTLDIGCGAGRNLKHCPGGSVGLDHNPLLVEACIHFGLTAFQPDQWEAKKASFLNYFDSLLLSHVAEHMTTHQCITLLQEFLPFLKSRGKVILICPQEAGFARDATHVEFMDDLKIRTILEKTGQIEVRRSYSFPFPRFMGKRFPFNEFVVLGRKK